MQNILASNGILPSQNTSILKDTEKLAFYSKIEELLSQDISFTQFQLQIFWGENFILGKTHSTILHTFISEWSWSELDIGNANKTWVGMWEKGELREH